MADINKIIRTELHLKIVKFFHENQAAIDTPRGISTWVREDRTKVKKALEELAGMKILVVHRSTSTMGYSYTRNAKTLSKIEKLLKKRRAA
jgi:hypothetical protein